MLLSEVIFSHLLHFISKEENSNIMHVTRKQAQHSCSSDKPRAYPGSVGLHMFYGLWYLLRASELIVPCTLHLITAHQSRVTALLFALQNEWVLSCGRDKYFQWHCSETGRRLGGYQTAAWCTCLQYPFLKAWLPIKICSSGLKADQ